MAEKKYNESYEKYETTCPLCGVARYTHTKKEAEELWRRWQRHKLTIKSSWELAAQAWSQPEAKNIPMNVRLAKAFARVLRRCINET